MPLLLWDVDLTLVAAGPAARAVFDAAVAAVLGRPVAPHEIVMAGKTDPQIADEVLDHAGVAAADRAVELPAIMAQLEVGLAAAVDRIRAEGRPMPGAAVVLERLAGNPEVVQTVLTGNIRPNAAVKLGAFGLDRWLDLDCGAYGSDSGVRTELVPVAVRRAERRHGRRFAPAETWVIGDTPLDLACARAAGVRCALVAAGRHGPDELRQTDADAVLDDLTDTAAVLWVLTGADGSVRP